MDNSCTEGVAFDPEEVWATLGGGLRLGLALSLADVARPGGGRGGVPLGPQLRLRPLPLVLATVAETFAPT